MTTSDTLPNLLVLGSAKCATTSLHFYLNQHPDVYMAKKKECHYFCHQDVNAELYKEQHRPVTSLEEYERLFEEGRSVAVRGESSPMYLYYPETAERMHDLVPDASLVAVIRNPADRAFSAYLHAVRDGIEELPFEEAIAAEDARMQSGKYTATHAYLGFGFYYEKLKPYFERFDQRQIRVYVYEEMTKDLPAVLADICRLAAIDDSYQFDTRPRLNVSGVPKRKWVHRLAHAAAGDHWLFNLVKKPFSNSSWVRLVKSVQYSNYEKPAMSSEVKQRVLARYTDDIGQLSELLGRDLSTIWNIDQRQPATQT